MRRFLLMTAIMGIAALLVSASVVARADNTTIANLTWRDSGLDLAPGYIYTISVHAEYQRVPFGGMAAQPEMEAGPLKIVVVFHPSMLGGGEFETKVYVNGELEWHGARGGCGATCGHYSYDRVFRLECDCRGSCVLKYGGEAIASFSLSRPVDILYNDDSHGAAFWHVRGRIRVTTSGSVNCYTPPPGNGNGGPQPQPQPPVQPPPTTTVNLPPGPDRRDSGSLSRLAGALEGAAGAALAVLLVGAAGLALAIGYKQAKRRKLLSIGLLLLLATPFFVYFNVASAELEPLSAFPVQDWRNGVVVIVCGEYYGTAEWIHDEYVLTAAHVLNGLRQCEIVRGSATSPAVAVAVSREYDIAVLRVLRPERFPGKHVFPIRSTPPQVDEVAYVIGYPSELVRIYAGSLARVSENPRVYRFYVPWYDTHRGILEIGRTDQGNSGGPIIDAAGQLIGVVSFALRTGVEYLFYGTTSNKIVDFLARHNVPFIPGNATAENIEEGGERVGNGVTMLHAAIAGAAASLVMDILILAVGVAIGAHAMSRRRASRRAR